MLKVEMSHSRSCFGYGQAKFFEKINYWKEIREFNKLIYQVPE